MGGIVHPQIYSQIKSNAMEVKRHNEGEDSVLQATLDIIPNITIHKKNNNMGIVEIRKKIFNGVNLFMDAENPNKTSKGNYRRTELKITNKNTDVFIEVKQQKTSSNITDSVLGEVSRARNIKGQYWLVLLGKPYQCPIVLYSIVEAIELYKLNDKVKVFTTIEQYKTELQKTF